MIDLTGKTCGDLQVLHLDADKVGSRGQRYWICKCACGNRVSVLGQSLRRLTTKSCGCKRNDRPKNMKVCVVCGKLYNAPPSALKVTCSPKCRSIHRASLTSDNNVRWGSDARKRKSEKGQDANLRKGTAAAKASPRAGAFTTNVSAKAWTLVSPEGITYEIRNLSLFAREHAAEYGSTPTKMSAGIKAIKRSMRGRTKRTVSSWKGWGLKGWED